MAVNLTILRERLTIAAVLRAHGLEPRRGRMPCPLHRGQNPQAFSIASSGKWAQCWACDFRGDGIALAQKLRGGSLGDAIRFCAGLVGAGRVAVHPETAKRIAHEIERRRLEAEAARRAEVQLHEDLVDRLRWQRRLIELAGTVRLDAVRRGDQRLEGMALDVLDQAVMRRDLIEWGLEEWRQWLDR